MCNRRCLLFLRHLTLCGVVALSSASVARAAQTYATSGISITFGDDGKVTSLLDTVSGCDRVAAMLPANRPYGCRIQFGGNMVDPTSFVFVGSQMIYTFGSLPTTPSITVGVTVRPTYLIFSLDNVSDATDIEMIQFLNFSTLNSLTDSLMRFMTYADCNTPRRLGVYPLDHFTRTDVGAAGKGGFLRAEAYPDLPWSTPVSMVGRRAALFTCADTQVAAFAACATIEAAHAIPLGVVAKQEPTIRTSQLFWMDFVQADAADVLAYTEAAGYGKILLNSAQWADTFNAYAIRADKWGSVTNLANWIDACHDAGILVGAHTLPVKIRKDSIAYIRDGCSPIVRRARTITLATDVPANQVLGLIQTTTPPTGWPDGFEKRDITINGEIIAFRRLKTDAPPYGFEGPFLRARNQTGGLGAQFHAAGSVIGGLNVTDDNWGYELDLAGGGLATYAADIATTYDAAGFDFIYLDGLEYKDVPAWYTLSAQQRTLYDAFANSPMWMESSGNAGTHSWPLLPIDGQIDYTYIETNGLKSEINRNLERMFSASQQTLMVGTPLQIGWIELSNPSTRHTTVDEIEYALAKSIAYDTSLTIQVWISSLRTWPHRDANLRLMQQYEQVRLAGSISQAQRTAARKLNKDFMLFRDSVGAWQLAPVSLLNVGGSPRIRAYVTDVRFGSDRFATFWPVDASDETSVTIHGVPAGSVSVTDSFGNAVPVTNIGGGQFRFDVRTRVYARLANLPDPVGAFSDAIVTNLGGP